MTPAEIIQRFAKRSAAVLPSFDDAVAALALWISNNQKALGEEDIEFLVTIGAVLFEFEATLRKANPRQERGAADAFLETLRRKQP